MPSPPDSVAALTRADVLGRVDRFPRWGLNRTSVLTIGLGMLFVQFDIFNINVSFVQTCVQIMERCEPTNADGFIGLPVFMSLVGYGVGALVLGALSDRFGRHSMLMASMMVTGLGSLYSMLSPSELHFVLSRLITGIGVGADLAIINVFVSEVSPRRERGRSTSLLFIMAAFGSALGIWLGLLLTTPMGPWPSALPFALASDSFTSGWRWIYGIGAVLAIVSLCLRISLPESPRWLVERGRLDEARQVVAEMEKIATRSAPLRAADHSQAADHRREEVLDRSGSTSAALRELFSSPFYLRRLAILGLVWMLGYVTIYAFTGAFTSVLVRQGFSASEAGMVSAVGLVGFIIAAFVARGVVDRIERKWWMMIGAVITVAGALVVAFGGGSPLVMFLGAIVLFFGQNLWMPAQYALTAEVFPTRFRTTAYAIADSIGHIGGGLGVFLLVSVLGRLPLPGTMLGLVFFLVAGAFVNLLAPNTKAKNLEDLAR
ncbi:MFS transporter [Amycolatopsis taiwanensis]|uniref:MFS transporter n=1 Tax=Amycolatopsis taiwanensis TaxID=342230 RepID=A0A9W6QYK9_9PSEU|nr:MFS transporter [Amycolatopsis taiwanensis]GLY65220.1 MFS transporter [Amycolatopsis taiwanensis]